MMGAIRQVDVHPYGNENANGQTATFTARGSHFAAYLHTSSAGGTSPTLDVEIEYSPDGIVWFAAINGGAQQFAQATAGGQYRSVIDQFEMQMYRVKWTIGGTAGPNFTFLVGLLEY